MAERGQRGDLPRWDLSQHIVVLAWISPTIEASSSAGRSSPFWLWRLLPENSTRILPGASLPSIFLHCAGGRMEILQWQYTWHILLALLLTEQQTRHRFHASYPWRIPGDDTFAASGRAYCT